MKSFSRVLRFGFWVLIFWIPAASIFAGEPDAGRPAVLQEVVVTATRDQEEIRKVPAHVTVVTEQEIRDSGATSLVEILERQEGIQFRSYSSQDPLSVIDLRGMGGDNPTGRSRFSSMAGD